MAFKLCAASIVMVMTSGCECSPDLVNDSFGGDFPCLDSADEDFINLAQSAIDPVNSCGLLGSDLLSLTSTDSEGGGVVASNACIEPCGSLWGVHKWPLERAKLTIFK